MWCGRSPGARFESSILISTQTLWTSLSSSLNYPLASALLSSELLWDLNKTTVDSLEWFCYLRFWGMLIHSLQFLIILSCNELFSHVILILACGLSLIWDYFWSAWVIGTLVCGSIFTERFYICHGWVSQGFYLSRMSFHSILSVWDSSAMWSVFGLRVHMWHRLGLGACQTWCSFDSFLAPLGGSPIPLT